MKIVIVFCTLLFLMGSCNKKVNEKKLVSTQDSIKAGSIKATYSKVELDSKAKKAVENWGEYRKMDEFIQQFQDISKTDALFNANELSELAQQLKDSIRIKKFEIPEIRIRLNVLHNESLRLADMATIPKITEIEVQNENENILNAFAALNLKINNIINQETLNEDLREFIDQLSTTVDTINIDGTSSVDSIKK